MSSRDRIIGIAVGSTVAVLALLWTYSSVTKLYTSRQKAKDTLETAVNQQRKLARQISDAATRMKTYEERYLPRKPTVASSLYQTWLHELFEKAGMSSPQVTPGKGKEERKLFASQKFTVHSQGTLPQVVRLLHGFYSADYMHRISRLHLRPIKDSKNLDILIDFEAMALERAADTAALQERPSDRLALKDVEEYVRIISERNLFGSANRAPQVSGLGEQKAIRGERAEFSARGNDPDKLDKLTYKVIKSGASEARLDSSSGRLTWTPRSKGKYEFIIRATDDGWPAKSSKDELLVVTVEDPPPPPVEAPRKLAFDDAKFTYLTAVIEAGGVGEIWLTVRPKGQTLKLGVGDPFEVGSIKGTVTAIGDGDFTFEIDGKEHKLTKGGILEQAVAVPEAE